MSRLSVKLVLCVVVILALALPAEADDPITNSLNWLKTQQQADGGFTNGFSEGSDLGTTCDVILALAAAGEDPTAWLSSAGQSPLDYLRVQVEDGLVEQVNQKAKVVLALTAAGEDASAFGGHDLLAELAAAYDEASGSFGGNTFDQALAILALAGAGQPVPEGAVQALLAAQAEDGAWALFGETAAGAGDTNTTALVLQALVAAGAEDGVAAALGYLHQVQNEDGGFPYQKPSAYGTDTDANSTAVVLQALKALGEELSDWAPQGTDPRAALEALYDPASGAFLWQAAVPGPNVLATAQAIPALAGYTFVALPMVGFGGAEPAAQPEAPPPVLPETGSAVAGPLSLALLVAGAVMLGAGLMLKRLARSRR